MLANLAVFLQNIPPEVQERMRETFEQAQNEIPPEALGVFAAFAGIMLFIWLGVYVYVSLCIHMIATKTNTSPAWLAWIPIANVILLMMISEKPMWWIVLMFIPFINIVWIVLGILVWMAVAEKRGKPGFIGILMIVPILNIFILGYLAFSN